MTITVKNRATANPRENFMIKEKEIFLHNQGETGLSKVGLPCANTDNLLSRAK